METKQHFDPAGINKDGDCLYACLCYAKDRRVPSNARVQQMRRQMLKWWVASPEQLREVAEVEGCSPAGYLRRFTREGWGGYPEVNVFVKHCGLTVRVVSCYVVKKLALVDEEHRRQEEEVCQDSSLEPRRSWSDLMQVGEPEPAGVSRRAGPKRRSNLSCALSEGMPVEG